MKVFIIAALSLDGFIAQEKRQSSIRWTSQEDQEHFQQATHEAGVIVMGSTTFATIGFPLPNRLNIVYSSKNKADFIAHYDLNEEQVQRLCVVSLEPTQLIESLQEEGFEQVAICGGSSIYTQFLQAGVVDELRLTIEPLLFGSGIKFFTQELKQKLKLKSQIQLNDRGTLLLTYQLQDK